MAFRPRSWAFSASRQKRKGRAREYMLGPVGSNKTLRLKRDPRKCRHSGENRNLATSKQRHWVPAFAGMTALSIFQL
jgi:hypothetical protein